MSLSILSSENFIRLRPLVPGKTAKMLFFNLEINCFAPSSEAGAAIGTQLSPKLRVLVNSLQGKFNQATSARSGENGEKVVFRPRNQLFLRLIGNVALRKWVAPPLGGGEDWNRTFTRPLGGGEDWNRTPLGGGEDWNRTFPRSFRVICPIPVFPSVEEGTDTESMALEPSLASA